MALEDTSTRGETGASVGMREEDPVVADAAIELSSAVVLSEGAGVAEDEDGMLTGGVEGAEGVAEPKPGLTLCSVDDLDRNMASICGFNIWPKGVARNSAGRPAGQHG